MAKRSPPPTGLKASSPDHEPDDIPVERDTTWSWDLDDPYAWDENLAVVGE